jgi:LAS superfamily LD-carboxypeptidase LdcB
MNMSINNNSDLAERIGEVGDNEPVSPEILTPVKGFRNLLIGIDNDNKQEKLYESSVYKSISYALDKLGKYDDQLIMKVLDEHLKLREKYYSSGDENALQSMKDHSNKYGFSIGYADPESVCRSFNNKQKKATNEDNIGNLVDIYNKESSQNQIENNSMSYEEEIEQESKEQQKLQNYIENRLLPDFSIDEQKSLSVIVEDMVSEQISSREIETILRELSFYRKAYHESVMNPADQARLLDLFKDHAMHNAYDYKSFIGNNKESSQNQIENNSMSYEEEIEQESKEQQKLQNYIENRLLPDFSIDEQKSLSVIVEDMVSEQISSREIETILRELSFYRKAYHESVMNPADQARLLDLFKDHAMHNAYDYKSFIVTYDKSSKKKSIFSKLSSFFS